MNCSITVAVMGTQQPYVPSRSVFPFHFHFPVRAFLTYVT